MTGTVIQPAQYRRLADSAEKFLTYFSRLLENRRYLAADREELSTQTDKALTYCRTLWDRCREKDIEDHDLRLWASRAGKALGDVADCSANERSLGVARDMLKALRMHCWYASLGSGVG